MEKLLTGKIALVTGASKGIGKGIAEKLAEHGASVAFTYLSSVEKGQALERDLQKHGSKIKGYRSDAADFKAAEELINAVVADFGGLDIVVNNARHYPRRTADANDGRSIQRSDKNKSEFGF